MTAPTRRLAVPLLFAAAAAGAMTAKEPAAAVAVSPLVTTQAGKLPIILSAPHGGTHDVPGVAARKGDGLEKGSKGFFAGRDSGTEELADALSDAVEKKTGKKPYLVAAKFHRKFIDANRPPEIAYEDPKAKPTYDVYRNALAAYCREVKKEYGRGLLLDLHGQGQKKDRVIRGTGSGKTVALLVSRYGEKAHSGPNSFFGLLRSNGVKVWPEDLADKDWPTLSGGHIVQTYGGGDFGIDAIQLEFGNDFRDEKDRKPTAEKVAATIQAFSKLYLEN